MVSLMLEHFDAAGAGLDRFQLIVTPIGYLGEQYNGHSPIHFNETYKEGFLDRFWDRGNFTSTLNTQRSLPLD